jgi:lipid A ethanolaminephosphotransferase
MRLMFIDTPKRPQLSATTLVILASLWLSLAGNLTLWKNLHALPEVSGWEGLGFTVAFAWMIACIVTAILSLFAWRFTLKPMITLLLIITGFATHYMWMYGIVLNTSMVINVLQTDVREASDQLSWRLLLTVIGLAGLPAIWLWRQPMAALPWGRQILNNLGLCALSLALAFGTLQLTFQEFASLMRNHTQIRHQVNPLNSVNAFLQLTVVPSSKKDGPLQPIGEDATLSNAINQTQKPPLLILVLGETARSQNFSLNGYARNTNPLLAKEQLTSFTQVASCGTSTAESVPCMFSHLGRQDFSKRSHEYENVLDVLQRAGYAVLWIDNQSGCKGQCDRIPTTNTASLKIPEHCDGGECRDTVMLARIDAELAKLPPERRARGTVVVMHQMGSHGPAYFKRTSPEFKKFKPECTDTSLAQCDREEIVNAYDNTLVLTDFFLSRVIGWLKAQENTHTPAMLYVSDHGESLGEKNIYLHGLPYRVAPPEQTTVPMITWLSPGFEKLSHVSTKCLQSHRDKALSHDNLFHSVLGLMAVKTSVYQRELDVFAACEGR